MVEGLKLGSIDLLGANEGTSDGSITSEGKLEGSSEGLSVVGFSLMTFVGTSDGVVENASLGIPEGRLDGTAEGD